jgi:hypothetical protein
MSRPMPRPEGDTCVLPKQALLLGVALTQVSEAARSTLRRRVRHSTSKFDPLEDLSRHMAVIERTLSHLTPRLSGSLNDVIQNEQAGAVEAGRAAGRLEQVLSELVDGYLEATATHADPDDREMRLLLLSVYRHHITEVCDWLDEMALAITDPMSSIQKRGIALADKVELAVSLTMTSPPEMEKLAELVARLRPVREVANDASPPFVRQQAPEPGLLGTLGAMVFGAGVANAVFGRDHG